MLEENVLRKLDKLGTEYQVSRGPIMPVVLLTSHVSNPTINQWASGELRPGSWKLHPIVKEYFSTLNVCHSAVISPRCEKISKRPFPYGKSRRTPCLRRMLMWISCCTTFVRLYLVHMYRVENGTDGTANARVKTLIGFNSSMLCKRVSLRTAALSSK